MAKSGKSDPPGGSGKSGFFVEKWQNPGKVDRWGPFNRYINRLANPGFRGPKKAFNALLPSKDRLMQPKKASNSLRKGPKKKNFRGHRTFRDFCASRC